jgi:hypothetical protein
MGQDVPTSREGPGWAKLQQNHPGPMQGNDAHIIKRLISEGVPAKREPGWERREIRASGPLKKRILTTSVQRLHVDVGLVSPVSAVPSALR